MRYYLVVTILITICCVSCKSDNFNLGNRLFEVGNYEGAIQKYSDALIESPDNFKIYFNRSLAWKKLNRMNKALEDLDRVIKLKPELPFPYLERGIILGEQGVYNDGLRDFNKAIELKSDYIQAYHNRGVLKGKIGEYASAVQDYSRALEIDPNYFPSLIGIAGIYQKQEKFDLSIFYLNLAIVVNKYSSDAYLLIGKAYYKLDNFELAIKNFDMALQLNSQIEEAYLYKGNILYLKCDIEKVIKNYLQAIDIQPNDSKEYNELAWIFATISDDTYRDGRKALMYAQEAIKLDYNYKNLDTLSAALAESGRFEDAIETQIKAINLCKVEKDSERLSQLLNRLKYYKEKKPWREECLPR